MKIQKNLTARSILDLFRLHGSLSQARLSQLSGLQASTVSIHVKRLRQLELLIPAGKAASSPEGGRPSPLLALNTELMWVGVAALWRGRLTYACVDLQGHLHEEQSHGCASLQEARDRALYIHGKMQAELGAKLSGLQWLNCSPDKLDEACGAGEASLYHFQATHTPATRPVLACHAESDPPHLQAAYGLGPGIGAHGENALLFSLPENTEPSALKAEILRSLFTSIALLSPAWLGLCGSMSTLLSPSDLDKLRETLGDGTLIVQPGPEAAIGGAAYQLQDLLLAEWLHETPSAP